MHDIITHSMCTKEEVQQIVDESEKRMEARMVDLLTKSHNDSYSKVISNFVSEIQAKFVNMEKLTTQILDQTTRTNGRVNALETWREVHKVETVGIAEKIDSVCVTLSRINWMIIAAVVVGVLGLVLK